ncbi:Zinc finger C2H2 type domain-containing protein [Penicillium ucsense]|uniref:Zinc finger C2H2 type domain-containing protein n=1 Tax=Penicillium ucsense TaxID=2839758 RepID=A0A8J8WCY9_9EURO|nr:Zinc finger C2H2 type domain-containing protein [Penicillium ucsense]KAF7737581.1 Zinc finger C2H2 type domain-containing protein [Penicillium ucsense]
MAKRSHSPSAPQDSAITLDSLTCSPSLSSTTSETKLPSDRSKLLHRDTVPFVEVMHCTLPPHRETVSFASYEDYEVHYQQTHVNRCSQCSKNFPTAHFLNLHIEENHDPLAAARRARGEKTYRCFIEDCERQCSSPHKRRLHLVDKHMFPRTYNFYIINDGIDKQTSLLRPLNKSHRRRISSASISSIQEGRLRRRSSVSQAASPTNVTSPASPASPTSPKRMEIRPGPRVSEDRSIDMELDGLTWSMSALRFVPASVTRNRGQVQASKKG